MTLSATTASAKKVIGIALETTPGTAVAPTYWLRVSKVSAKDETTPLTDETFQGDRAAVHQIVPGTIHSKVSITMPVALDTAGFAFAGILGHYLYNAGTPNVHNFVLDPNNPKTYTITDYSGPVTKVYAGCTFESVKIMGSSDKLVEFEVSLFGQASNTVSTPSPSWTTELPLPTWASIVKVGANSGSAVDATADNWEIEIKADVAPGFTASGTRNATYNKIGTVDASFKFTGICSTPGLSEVSAFAAGTSRYFSVQLVPAAGGSEGALIEILSGTYKDGNIDGGSLKDIVKYELDGITASVPSTLTSLTGYSTPVQVTLNNAVPSGIYA